MAGDHGFRNPLVDSSITVHCVFQSTDQTVEVFAGRKHRDQGIDQIRTVLLPKFVQVLLAIGVTVLSVNRHDSSGVEHAKCTSEERELDAVL